MFIFNTLTTLYLVCLGDFLCLWRARDIQNHCALILPQQLLWQFSKATGRANINSVFVDMRKT